MKRIRDNIDRTISMALSNQYPLLWELAKRDLWEKYSGSSLGALWSVIYPLVTVFIYLIIFSNIMSARLPGSTGIYSYSIYLIAGVIPWTLFTNTVTRSASVYIDKKNIISKIHVDLNCFPLFIAIAESIIFWITFSIFLIFLLLTGYQFAMPLIFFPILFAGQQLLAYTIGSILGILVVFIRDIKEIVNVIFQFWFWLTPIIYVISIIPEPLQIFEQINPAYWFIAGYQDILCFENYPNLYMVIALFVSGIVLLYIKQTLMRRLERDIRDFI